MKLVFCLLVAVLALVWFKRAARARRHDDAAARSRPPSAQTVPEAMLPCACCGIHVPASEAVRHAPGMAFCCEEHRRRVFPGG